METLYRRYIRSVTTSRGTLGDDQGILADHVREGYSLGQRYLASLTRTRLPPRQGETRTVGSRAAEHLLHDLESVPRPPSALSPRYTYRRNLRVRLLAAVAATATMWVALGVILTVNPHHSRSGAARPHPVPRETIPLPRGGIATPGIAQITNPADGAKLVAGSYVQFQGLVVDPVAPGHHLELFETLFGTPPYFLASVPDGIAIDGWAWAWAGVAYIGGRLTFYLVDRPPAALRELSPGPYHVKHGYASISSLGGTILAKVTVIAIS